MLWHKLQIKAKLSKHHIDCEA